MTNKKEVDIMMTTYKADFAALEDRKKDMMKLIEIMEYLIPTELMRYMKKICQTVEIPNSQEKFPQHEIENAKEHLEHLDGVLKELLETVELIKKEQIQMGERMKELEIVPGQIDQQPSNVIIQAISTLEIPEDATRKEENMELGRRPATTTSSAGTLSRGTNRSKDPKLKIANSVNSKPSSTFSNMDELNTGENIIDFSILDPDEQELVKASVRAREHAYCPYSHFSVGAAARVQTGSVYTGCNIENAAYPDSLCAERTALAKAVSEGNTSFSAVAVSGSLEPNKKFVFPCGSCRQFISEFARDKDIPIYLVKPDLKHVLVTSIKQLLPHSFHF